MGGKVTEPIALWLRCTFDLSSETGLSDTAEGERRGGEVCGTSSALPSTDMERRKLDDCGGGRTCPGAVEEGRDAGMNSCLHGVNLVYEDLGQNARTCKSLGYGGDNGELCRRAIYLQNIPQSLVGMVVEVVEAGLP